MLVAQAVEHVLISNNRLSDRHLTNSLCRTFSGANDGYTFADVRPQRISVAGFVGFVTVYDLIGVADTGLCI